MISIGNITWGGTGKTPFVEWLVQYLKEKKIKPAVLIRGYMMKSFLQNAVILRPKAEESHVRNAWDSSALSGLQNDGSDEASMLQQFFPDVPVLVGRNRIQNAKQALKEHSRDVFVLDDGFQHWKLERDLDIVAIDCMNPFGNGCLIPRGILREPLKSLTRADLFVLTKTDWGKENISLIKKKLHSINPDAPVIETVHRPTALLDLCDPSVKESLEFLNGKTVAAFCGIGQPDSFARLLKSLGADVVVFKAFGDHQLYRQEDVLSLLNFCREKKVQTLVTTQKDAVKLTPFLNLFKGNVTKHETWRHSERSPEGEVKNLIGEEILRSAIGLPQDDSKEKFRFLSVKMEIQITQGHEELCGRISRLLDR